MKPNEIHLIDRNALRQLRELHLNLSQLELAVCRALQHIGRIPQEYGCWTTMERLVMRILGNEAEVCVGCAKKDLCRKASERPYHLPLRRWTEYLNQPKVERYYLIGITLLRLLEEECSGKQTGKVDNFLDRNRQKG